MFLDERFPAIQDLAHTIGPKLAGAPSRQSASMTALFPGVLRHGDRPSATVHFHSRRGHQGRRASAREPGIDERNYCGSAFRLNQPKYSNSGHIYRQVIWLGPELMARSQMLAATPFHPAVPVCLVGRMERQLRLLCYAARAWYDALHRTPDIHDERNHELRHAAASWTAVTGNPVVGRLREGKMGLWREMFSAVGAGNGVAG